MAVTVQVRWSSLVAADRRLEDLLSPVEKARLATFDHPADQGRSLVGAALLRTVVGEHLGVPPHEVVVDRTCAECGEPHGRPRIHGAGAGAGAGAPFVSVSHSGLLVVVALSADAPVGVDVQRLADIDVPPAGERVSKAAVADAWVRREAVVKLGDDAQPGLETDVRSLAAPLDGYAAALATVTRPPTDVRVLVSQVDSLAAPA